MHPCNKYYESNPDFRQLYEHDEAFAAVCKGPGKVDWAKKDASYELARALLKADFGVEWEMPKQDYLVPAVTRTVNYLLWIEDLLQVMQALRGGATEERRVGLDVGTGASCIFPLIGCRLFPQWSFHATDINEGALKIAQENVNRNGLENTISLHLVEKDTYILDKHESDFTVCNPPFFETYQASNEQQHEEEEEEENIYLPRPKKQRIEFHGKEAEKRFQDEGELGFFKAMFLDSEKKKTKTLFSCMFGHKQSCRKALDFIQEKHFDSCNVMATTLVQGLKTRWALAWCFHERANIQLLEDGNETVRATSIEKARESLQDNNKHINRTIDFANLTFEIILERVREYFQPFEIFLLKEQLQDKSWKAYAIVHKEDKLRFAFYIILKNTKLNVAQVVMGCNRKELNDFIQRLEQDVRRTSRKWRRKEKAINSK